MFKNVMLAAAATLAIAGGALGASAGTASASDVTVRIGNGGPYYGHHRDRFCRPIFRNVKVYRHHRVFIERVKVGENCGWRRW